MIHYFQKSGMNIVLDVPSGAIHLLDDLCYQLVAVLNEQQLRSGEIKADLSQLYLIYGCEDVNEAMAELRELINEGLLYTQDDYDAFAERLELAPVKAMCLHIAHDCNLRCRYCFASTGDFGGQRSVMSEQTAFAAIDFLVQNSAERHNLEVDFFGGEPLMNFDVVRKTVDYARSLEEKHNKHFRFTITTNGLGLTDSIIEYINENMDNVVLSLDGRKEINDFMRPMTGGKGSFDVIVPKYQRLVDDRKDKDYYLRGTYTKNNLDFFEDVLAINDLGFDNISVEPVVLSDESEFAIDKDDVAAIAKSYDTLLDEMMARKGTDRFFTFFHFWVDLQNGPCAIKRLKGCGCGNEYLAITPEGDIYPCHQFVGDKTFLMGNIHDEKELNMGLKRGFSECHLLNKKDCVNCWAKYFCSGGCNANNYAFNHDLLKPHDISCELERIRLECALALQIALKAN